MYFFSTLLTLYLFASQTLGCGPGLHVRTSDDAPQYAPIPAGAGGIPLVNGYGVQSFGQGAYMVTDGSYQAFFLVSTKGVIVVDCPPSIGHMMLYAIGNITSIPITHLIYSHSHADHIGAAWIFSKDIQIIAHIDTAHHLSLTPDPTRPPPKITFQESYNVYVGNQTVELSYKGENHITGNIFIYAPIHKVLILIDVVFPGWTPFAGLGEAKSLPGYINAHAQILEYDFEHYIGGHLGRSGNRTDVLVQQEYVNDLFANCKAAINLSATSNPVYNIGDIVGPVVAKNPGNTWAVYKTYLDTLTELCANTTNEKWLGRLAAADVYQFENAGFVLESLRIDYSVLGPGGTV
ncbi:Metallo-hydrolase/oxidoreductase [Stipitochalara longipes BDJ]|nr:Metallo-hydrolase/oxidoreductase [Stipitochalara longipes BDJ]